MPEIEISEISKVYSGNPEVTALENINLKIHDGEFICILGPSGCGKSTLLSIISGLEPSTSGIVKVGGKPVTGPGPSLGVVFQDPSLYPWRTVADNIGLGLELRGVPPKDRQDIVNKHIELVKLTGFEKKYPHQLSGGMKQRAGLARTLANGPLVLLMDEPFGAVDHLTRLKLQEDLLDIWQNKKKTVVFVTHDVHEAVFLGDRVVLLSPRPGKIQEVFNIRLGRPRSRDDAELIAIQEEIYSAIYEVRKNEELEYLI
jgi:ABC-type nitrate/sulfonate/bicarbonate transport system ATPase subunit